MSRPEAAPPRTFQQVCPIRSSRWNLKRMMTCAGWFAGTPPAVAGNLWFGLELHIDPVRQLRRTNRSEILPCNARHEESQTVQNISGVDSTVMLVRSVLHHQAPPGLVRARTWTAPNGRRPGSLPGSASRCHRISRFRREFDSKSFHLGRCGSRTKSFNPAPGRGAVVHVRPGSRVGSKGTLGSGFRAGRAVVSGHPGFPWRCPQFP